MIPCFIFSNLCVNRISMRKIIYFRVETVLGTLYNRNKNLTKFETKCTVNRLVIAI